MVKKAPWKEIRTRYWARELAGRVVKLKVEEDAKKAKDEHIPTLLELWDQRVALEDAVAADKVTADHARFLLDARMNFVEVHFVHRTYVLTRHEMRGPRMYLSITPDNNFAIFTGLNAATAYYNENLRWIHDSHISHFDFGVIYARWLAAIDPFYGLTDEQVQYKPKPAWRETAVVRGKDALIRLPLLSVFSATHNSTWEKLWRVLASLLEQKYEHWEWVIVDDSEDERHYDEVLKRLSQIDGRVRVYRPDGHSGYIGSIKRQAASLCRGEVLIEVDDDDDLSPDLLRRISWVYESDPNFGVIYTDFCETFTLDNYAHYYGKHYAYGHGMIWTQWVSSLGRWQNGCRTSDVSPFGSMFLPGLPNHARCWRRDAYEWIGRHQEELLINDDQHLLTLSILAGLTFTRIPHLSYIQYRNGFSNALVEKLTPVLRFGQESHVTSGPFSANRTFERLDKIQLLGRRMRSYYFERLVKYYAKYHGMEYRDLSNLDQQPYLWSLPPSHEIHKHINKTAYNVEGISYIIPLMNEQMSNQDRKLVEGMLSIGHQKHWENIELILVGSVPVDWLLDHPFGPKGAPDGAIRWFFMPRDKDNVKDKDFTQANIEQYGMLIRSCLKWKMLSVNAIYPDLTACLTLARK